MHQFQTVLVSGTKRPYSAWVFLVIPPAVAAEWGPGPREVRGTVACHVFQGKAARGEGAMRVPISRQFRELAGLRCGDAVEASLEPEAAPRPIVLPPELLQVLESDPALAECFSALPPSMRRAWADYVARGTHAATRTRRAGRAPDGIRARAFPRG